VDELKPKPSAPGSELVGFYRGLPGAARWPVETVLWLGVLAAFIATSMWGVLEIHSSNDTYIGLEAGRKIMSSEEFPTYDWFSYTFEGKEWINQNWLSHVYLWLLYDHLGPNWTIYGTWAMGWLIFIFVGGTVYLRTHSLLAALVTGALVGFGCRDWLSARPATFQFTMMSGTWFALWALMSQGERKWRWWAIGLLMAIMLAWPHAHGSFMFGIGLVGMVIGAEVGVAVLNWIMSSKEINTPALLKPILPWSQIIGVGAVVLLAIILGWVLSPFGYHNYTHPFTVSDSDIFRTVSEWIPPYKKATYPPVGRFWLLMWIAGISLPLVPLLFLVDVLFGWWKRETTNEQNWGSPKQPPSPVRLQVIAVDIAALVIGLYMAMWARRFIPMLYILAAPGIATWLMYMGSRWSPNLRWMMRMGVMLGMAVFAVRVGMMTQERYHKEYTLVTQQSVHPLLPASTFLENITRVNQNPRMIYEWLSRNHFEPNVFTEWTLAGTMAFYVPGLQVYIDGRSQQVYDENHYLSYQYFGATPVAQGMQNAEALLRLHTEAVIVPPKQRWAGLLAGLEQHPGWIRVMQTRRVDVFGALDSEFVQDLMARELEGEVWWPETAAAAAARGNLRLYMNPPRVQEAWNYLLQGIAGDVTVGRWAYPTMVRIMLMANQKDQALNFIRGQRDRLERSKANASRPALAQIVQLQKVLSDLEAAVDSGQFQSGR
jgi:hypothetical protein